MAKKKTNSDKKEEESAVLEYLTRVNRPYSATDIFNNLHAKYTKGSVVKALDQLIRDDLIVSKTYGKTVIYLIKQSLDDVPSEEEINALQKSMDELTEEHEKLSAENKQLDQTLAKIKSEPTTSEAKGLLEKTKAENAQLREKLTALKTGTVLIPPEKRKRADDEYDTYRQLWRKRRGMFRDIFKTVTEHYPGNPRELKEELGIEEDPIPFEQDPLVNL
ncbi:Tat binding protein 1-interacting protein-domain-containing protein [Parasitella parasitica]|nr:Tat binding protein 1-interacting protein-domain-containing protein [Parasitella parasitica]